MNELIMNLVSLITDQVRTKQDLFRNEGKIMDSLMNSGYRIHEADAALTFMQALAQAGEDGFTDKGRAGLPAGMRTMNAGERSRFTIDAFSFISKLAHLGIITGDQREDLLEKALSLHPGKIDLEQVKSLLAVNLLTDDQNYEDALPSALNQRGMVWN